MKKCIKVLFGTKQQLQCKKMTFVYGDSDSPTISDVKAAASAQLHIALERCIVKVQMPNNTTATLSDTERFSYDDNIWIDATDTSKRTKTISAATVFDEVLDNMEDSPSDESSTYILKYQKTQLILFRRNTYLEWNDTNDTSISLLYHMAKPKTDLKLGNTNIYDYFDATMTRGLIVLAYYRNAVPNIVVLEDAKRRLRNHTTDMTFKAFKTNDYTTQAKLATQLLNSWLNTNFIPSWSAAGCESPIAQALTSRGYRDRKTSGMRKSQSKKFKKDEAALKAFSTVLEAMIATTDETSLQNMYKTTASIRRPWLMVMLHDSDSVEDAVDVFFDQLPFLSDNLQWLHYDFTECMQKTYDKIPNFRATLTMLATAIISTATQHRLSHQEDEDVGLHAADAVIHLINKYCKLKEDCKMDSILLRDIDGRNENDLLRLKNAITIKPMIVMTSDENGRNYYIALQRRMLKLRNSDFSDAFQLYMELFYTFDLAYDSSPAPFFEFFSIIEGINKTPKATLLNLTSTIQFVYDGRQLTAEEATSASITESHSDNDNNSSDANGNNDSTQS